MQSYQKALAITQALVDREPTASHRTALAESHLLLADMFWAEGSFVVALEHYRLAVTLRDRLAADDPNQAMRLELALGHYGVGQTLLRMGDYAGAADAYTRAQALQFQVVKEDPSNALARRSFATSASKLGDVLAVQGDHRRALDFTRKRRPHFETSSAADPVSPRNQEDAGDAAVSDGDRSEGDGPVSRSDRAPAARRSTWRRQFSSRIRPTRRPVPMRP